MNNRFNVYLMYQINQEQQQYTSISQKLTFPYLYGRNSMGKIFAVKHANTYLKRLYYDPYRTGAQVVKQVK